ncbi:MAG: NHL repeat-containing protein [Acidimicrobiales bacterium]
MSPRPRRIPLASLAVALIGALAVSANVPGALASSGGADPTWGVEGVASLPTDRVPRIPVAEALGDGSVIVATNLGVTKLGPDGRVESSYGNHGSTDAGIEATFIGIDPLGRAVLVGVLNPGGSSPTSGAVRLLPTGQLDTSFGSGGTATVAGGRPVSAIVDPLGRTLIETVAPGQPVGPLPTLFRLGPDGRPDRSWNGGQPRTLGVPTGGPIAIAPDGSVVVVGLGPPPARQWIDRLPADGGASVAASLSDARATFPATSARVEADGAVHVVGDSEEELVRPDLRLDASFGQGACGDPRGLPAQPGGTLSLLADGRTVDVANFGPQSYDLITNVFVRRDGRRDLTYGDGGHSFAPGFDATSIYVASTPTAIYLEQQSAPSSSVSVVKLVLRPADVVRRGPASTGSAWVVGADGGVLLLPGFYGTPPAFCGSMGGTALNLPVVGGTGASDGVGYWLVASDGGTFSFGDARFYGSTGGMRLNQPIVGMAATPDGRGYWHVARDGGVFSFGDARFYGSTGGMRLNQPIVGMAATADGRGYWLVARDGGIFNFGDAAFLGSAAGNATSPIVGVQITRSGGGYWLATAAGTAYGFGDAGYAGNVLSTGSSPVVGIAAAPPDTFTVIQADGSAGNSDFGPSHLPVAPARPIVGIFNAE